MDQFVVDLADPEAVRDVRVGDEVVIFGPGDAGRADRRGLGPRRPGR